MNEDTKKHMLKTGTTTLGIVTTEGIVIAADKQASYGSGSGVGYIAGKISKIKEFNKEVILTIAGTATFALRAIQTAKAQMKIKELKDRKKPTLKEIANLFSIICLQSLQSGGVIGFLMAGRENGKAVFYRIGVDGITEKVDDYHIDGSGMMHVNAILDTEYHKNLTLKEGITLAKRCIVGSSGRDPASGVGYEIWTVTPEKVEKIEDKTWKLD